MPTKTVAPRTLEEVRSAHDALIAKAEAGEQISPLDLLEASGAVSIAEAAAHGVDARAQEAAEATRVARIGQLVASLDGEASRDRAARLLTLHAEAIAALNALHREAVDYSTGLNKVDAELRTLGDLGPNISLSKAPGTIRVNGVRHTAGHLMPAMLVVDAAAQVEGDYHTAQALAFAARHMSSTGVTSQLRDIAGQ